MDPVPKSSDFCIFGSKSWIFKKNSGFNQTQYSRSLASINMSRLKDCDHFQNPVIFNFTFITRFWNWVRILPKNILCDRQDKVVNLNTQIYSSYVDANVVNSCLKPEIR